MGFFDFFKSNKKPTSDDQQAEGKQTPSTEKEQPSEANINEDSQKEDSEEQNQ